MAMKVTGVLRAILRGIATNWLWTRFVRTVSGGESDEH